MNSKNKKFKKANSLYRSGDYEFALKIYKELNNEVPDFKYYKQWIEKCESHILGIKKKYDLNINDKEIIYPKFTIIITALDEIAGLEETLNSALEQFYESFEIIIAQSGNDAMVNELLLRFKKNKNLICVKTIHGGRASALNLALEKSIGEFICYLEHGWLFNSDHLSQLSKIIDVNEGSNISAFTSKIEAKKDCQEHSNKTRQVGFESDCFLLTSFCHKRKLYETLGGFNEEYAFESEKDFLLRYSSVETLQTSLRVWRLSFDSSLKKSPDWPDLPRSVFCFQNSYSVNWKKLQTKKRTHEKISIIVLFISNPEMTVSCIESIFLNTDGFDIEVVVVDNGSEPTCGNKVKKELEKFSEKIVYITNSENTNFSLGNNIGFARSQGEYIVFLNNDTLVSSGWLNPLISSLKTYPKIGFVQPLLIYPDGSVQCSIAGFSSISPVPYHLYKNYSSESKIINKRRYVSTATAACLVVRAADFSRLKGFDTIFVNGCEDSDLCLRYRNELNMIGLYEPLARVIHYESKSKGRMKYFYHNRYAFCKRWLSRTPIDDVSHFKDDGFFVESYNPIEKTDLQYPWIRRIDNPKLVSIDLLNKENLRILVVKPSGLGNMTMFRPALELLQKELNNSSIFVLCFEADAFAIRDIVSGTIVIKRNENGSVDTTSLSNAIDGLFFDIAIYPPFTSISKPTPQLALHCKHHIIHPHVGFEYRHEILHNYDLIYMLGVENKNQIDKHKFLIQNKSILGSDYVAIHIGTSLSSHMKKKKWPKRYWADLIELITQKFRVKIVGGSGDLPDTNDVLQMLNADTNKLVTVSVGNYNFADLSEVLRSSICFISSDAGLMHVASYAGANVIGIFGPTNPTKNGPWADRAITLLPSNISCSPCYTAGPDRLNQCEVQLCLFNIKPDSVYEKVLSFAISDVA